MGVEYGESSPNFQCNFCKTLPTKKMKIKTFQNCGIWTLLMYLLEFMEVIVCKPDMSPET